MANRNAGARAFYTRQSDNRTYEFCPVPLIAHSMEYVKQGSNERGGNLVTIHSLTLNGALLPENPSLSGVSPDASCLEILDRKKDQLAYALAEDRGNLLIVDASGYTVLNVNPIIRSFSVDESSMVSVLRYNIEIEYETDYGLAKVKEFDENWDISQNDDDTWAINHSLSARGIPDLPIGTGALTNARNFILGHANTAERSHFIFSSSPYVPGIIDINNLAAYNHRRSENCSLTEGTYSLTESWILSSGNYKDDRTINASFTYNENGDEVQTIELNGTIVGYGDTTFERYTNAHSAFYNVVAPEIGFFSPGNQVTKNFSLNRFAGTVNYSISKVPASGDQLENKSISRQFQFNEDGSVSQTVTTTAKARVGSIATLAEAQAYCEGLNYPINSLDPPFNASLSGNIENVSKTVDDLTISYSLTKTYRDQEVDGWREEFEVNREENADTATVVVTVNGTVFGLVREPGTKTTARFVAASGAYYNVINPLIYSRALSIIPTGTCLASNPVRKSIGQSQLAGRITYNFSYENRPVTANPSILSEKIATSYKLPTEVFVEFGIPGKATGPVIQDQQTVTSRSKSLSITYTIASEVVASGICGEYSSSAREDLEAIGLTESEILVSNTRAQHTRGEKPIATRVFKSQDEYNFSDQNVFTRNVTWVY